jgi:hypothetical protein
LILITLESTTAENIAGMVPNPKRAMKRPPSIGFAIMILPATAE